MYRNDTIDLIWPAEDPVKTDFTRRPIGSNPHNFAVMEEDFRHLFYPGHPERETTFRVRRIADRDRVTYLFNIPGEDTFRMKQNSVGQWEFEDRLHAPMLAIDLETELIRIIRENED